MPGNRPVHPAALDEDLLLQRCELHKSRSSGPGGQHRNKVETHVTITHTPTGISGQAGERRSAAENKQVALFRLRLNLATEVRAAVPLGDARSDLWKSRCIGGKLSCSPSHRDFPSMLAEALDMIEACDLDEHKAAIRLECSMSQLVKLVKEHPAAFTAWNRRRSERRAHPLR